MSEKLKSAVEAAVATAVKVEIRNPGNALDAAPGHAEQAAVAVAERAMNSPEMRHLTSSEEWWRSRANWSAIFSTVTGLSAFQYLFVRITGYEWVPIPADELAAYSMGATLLSGVIAGYLARRARTATRPLGR